VKTVLITGARGFIGRNLAEACRRRQDLRVETFDSSDAIETLDARVRSADIICHLAGVNRPGRVEDFEAVNGGLTRRVASAIITSGAAPLIVLASSTQAVLDNPYGVSKRNAEDALRGLGDSARVRVFRLPGVFGTWCRPCYNSVVATFCHNVARGLPITVSDPLHELELVYVDDVVGAFVSLIDDPTPASYAVLDVKPVYRVLLGRLADAIVGFGRSRVSLQVPDLGDPFTKRLHSTYLTYLNPQLLARAPEARTDQRGMLVELLKSTHGGQIFVSRTRPGVTRGNHYHDTKVEWFCVVQGDAVIRLRRVHDDEVVTYPVSGRQIEIVDIPPGYTHSIENVGDEEMVTLFWASELFDPVRPDTFACAVPGVPA
jgi:UDP-2-acetamido-2,6-beta-L-arabino-hexul-4-ose reductase